MVYSKIKQISLLFMSILISAIIFCCASLMINPERKTLPTEVNGALVLDSNQANGTLAEGYQSNSVFTISSEDGYNEFAKFLALSTVIYETSDLAGNTTQHSYTNDYFKNKTVKLTADISVSSYVVPTFAGTLDGQGHTISFSGTYTTSGSGDAGAFLNTNNGTIKNLKIYGVDVFVSYVFLGSESRVSAFVGTNNGTIDGCIVNDCTFKSDRAKTNCTVTTFCVTNNGTISNCMATGTVALELQGSDKGIKSCYFVITGNEATNSIYAASCTEDSSYNSDKCDTPLENGDTALSSGKGNFSSCADAHSNMSSSYLSNTAGASGTVFYKYTTTDYGYGQDSKYCVYLRAFISGWTSYSFASADTSQGTVDTSSLTVPEEYASVSKTGRSLQIYSSTITAKPLQGYMFSSWTNSGNAYTANFTEGYYFFEFSALKIGNQTINPITYVSGVETTDPIKVGVSTQTTVECTHTATQTTITYYYDNYQTVYTITDVKYTLDKSGTYSFLIWDDDTDVTAVPIEEFGNYMTTYWFGYEKTFEFTAPTVKLKTYNTVFG